MPDAPTAKRPRIAAAAGLLGASAAIALLLGVGPAPSALQLAGASSDDVADDISGNCDEAEHAGDPECSGAPTSGGATSSTIDDDTTSTTAGGGVTASDDVRSLDAAGAGTVIYAIEDGGLRLVTATPASGWAVEVEQSAGREVELDFRAGTRRVQVNLEIEDGEVRERVRFRDDADDTDVRTEDGVVVSDDSTDDNSNSGPGSGDEDHSDDDSGPGSDDDDDHSGSGHDGDDSGDDDSSGSGRDHPEDD